LLLRASSPWIPNLSRSFAVTWSTVQPKDLYISPTLSSKKSASCRLLDHRKNYLWVVICRSCAVALMSADQFSRLSLRASCHASNLLSMAGVIMGLRTTAAIRPRDQRCGTLVPGINLLGRPLRGFCETVQQSSQNDSRHVVHFLLNRLQVA
jgi:hypothetical protein